MSQPEFLGNTLKSYSYDFYTLRQQRIREEQRANSEKTKEELKKRLAEFRANAGASEELKPAQPVNLRTEQKNYTIAEEAKKRVEENSSYINEKGEIELPEEISELIDNPRYERKFKFLAREWGMKLLLIAVEIAKTKNKPSHYFATMTAKPNREGTFKWLQKLREKRERLAERLEKLGADLKYLPYAMGAETKLGIKKLEEIFRIALGKEAKAHYFARAISNELNELKS